MALSFIPDMTLAAARAAASRAGTVGKPPPPSASPQPKPTSPWSPLTDAQIQKQIDDRLNAEMAAMSDPIKAAAAAAAARAVGAEKAQVGFTGAAQAQLPGVGSLLHNAYLGSKVSMPAGSSPEAQPFAGAENQAIGGTGQAAETWASLLSGIQGNLGQENLASLIAKGEQEQQGFSQQLIDLAKQRPDLRAKIQDALFQHEYDKLNARLAQAKSTKDISLAEADYRLRVRAEAANERALGLRGQQYGFQNELAVEKLKLQSQRDAAYITHIEQQGGRIDAPASKVAGHIVLQDGSVPTGANGKPIAVASTATGAGKNSYGKAVAEARTLRGTPIPYTGKRQFDTISGNQARTTTIKGKYLAAPWAKGVFTVPDPDNPGYYIRTTNDPKKAATNSGYTFVQAQEYIMNRWGLSRARARAALVAAGWRPDGVRP